MHSTNKKLKKSAFTILRSNFQQLSLEAVIIPGNGIEEKGKIRDGSFNLTGTKHVISASLDSASRNSTGAEKEKALQESYRKAFKAAGELGCKTLGLPFPAWESYGIPKETELKVLEEEIRNFILEHPVQVVLAVKEKKLSLVSGKLFDGIQNFIESNAEQEEDSEDILYSGPVPLGAVPVQGKPIHNRREYSHAPKRLLCEEPAECDTEIAGTLPEADGIQDFIDSAGGKLNFQNTLQHLIAERKLDNATVYKKAFIITTLYLLTVYLNTYCLKKSLIKVQSFCLLLNTKHIKQTITINNIR